MKGGDCEDEGEGLNGSQHMCSQKRTHMYRDISVIACTKKHCVAQASASCGGLPLTDMLRECTLEKLKKCERIWRRATTVHDTNAHTQAPTIISLE